MKIKFNFTVLFLFFSFAGIVLAVEESSNVVGTLEVRPSYESKVGRIFTENSAEVGYKVSPTLELTYAQNVDANLYNDKSATASMLSPTMQDGFLRFRVNKIATTTHGDRAFSYQGRIYAPTVAADRDAGFITANRNYFILSQKVNDTLSLSLMEIPVLYVFNSAGTVTDGVPSANPVFENRVYLIADINITKSLSLSVPLMLNSTRFADFDAAAELNGTWGHILWTYPELIYAVSPNLNVGLAFYSKALATPDLSSFTIGAGLEKGVTQLVLAANL